LPCVIMGGGARAAGWGLVTMARVRGDATTGARRACNCRRAGRCGRARYGAAHQQPAAPACITWCNMWSRVAMR